MISRDHLYTQPRNLVTFLGLHDVPRFASETGATAAGLQLAWTFLATARGTPLVYYGDELGMPGSNDPDNRRDFPGGWTTDDRNAFTPEGRTPAERQVFDHLRTLLRFRRDSNALRRGAMIHLAVDEQIYAYARTTERETVLVAINNGGNVADIKMPVSALRLAEGTTLTDLLGGTPVQIVNGHVTVSLPARSSGVWRPK
jgi:glycosidase